MVIACLVFVVATHIPLSDILDPDLMAIQLDHMLMWNFHQPDSSGYSSNCNTWSVALVENYINVDFIFL